MFSADQEVDVLELATLYEILFRQGKHTAVADRFWTGWKVDSYEKRVGLRALYRYSSFSTTLPPCDDLDIVHFSKKFAGFNKDSYTFLLDKLGVSQLDSFACFPHVFLTYNKVLLSASYIKLCKDQVQWGDPAYLQATEEGYEDANGAWAHHSVNLSGLVDKELNLAELPRRDRRPTTRDIGHALTLSLLRLFAANAREDVFGLQLELLSSYATRNSLSDSQLAHLVDSLSVTINPTLVTIKSSLIPHDWMRMYPESIASFEKILQVHATSIRHLAFIEDLEPSVRYKTDDRHSITGGHSLVEFFLGKLDALSNLESIELDNSLCKWDVALNCSKRHPAPFVNQSCTGLFNVFQHLSAKANITVRCSTIRPEHYNAVQHWLEADRSALLGPQIVLLEERNSYKSIFVRSGGDETSNMPFGVRLSNESSMTLISSNGILPEKSFFLGYPIVSVSLVDIHIGLVSKEDVSQSFDELLKFSERIRNFLTASPHVKQLKILSRYKTLSSGDLVDMWPLVDQFKSRHFMPRLQYFALVSASLSEGAIASLRPLVQRRNLRDFVVQSYCKFDRHSHEPLDDIYLLGQNVKRLFSKVKENSEQLFYFDFDSVHLMSTFIRRLPKRTRKLSFLRAQEYLFNAFKLALPLSQLEPEYFTLGF